MEPQSKYEQVKRTILDEIESGNWKEGEKIPPQRTLEDSHQVSRITVKKAIVDLISEGVLEHQKGKKGLFVKKKQQVRTGNRTIAVSLDDITSYYDSNLLKGIEDSLWKQSYHTIVCNANRNMDKVEDYFNSFDFSKVDGIIYLPVVTPDFEERNRIILQLFRKHNKPFVLIDQYIPGVSANLVSTDHRNSAKQLIKALIDRGHRDILIGKGLDCFSVSERVLGVKDAFAEAGLSVSGSKVLEINDNLLTPRADPNPDEMHKIEEMIRGAGEFTAFYAINNRIMKAVVQVLIKLGYDMSKIQLVLHNEVNKPVHPYTDNIPHTDPHLHDLGYEAGSLLLKVMDSDSYNSFQLFLNSTIILDGLK